METIQVVKQLIIGILTAIIIIIIAAIFTPNGSSVFYFITIPTVIGYMVFCIIIEHKARQPIDSYLCSKTRDLMHPEAKRHLPLDNSIDATTGNANNIMAAMELDLDKEQEFQDILQRSRNECISNYKIFNNTNTNYIPESSDNSYQLKPSHDSIRNANLLRINRIINDSITKQITTRLEYIDSIIKSTNLN